MLKRELLDLLKDIDDDKEILEVLQKIEGVQKAYTLEDFKKQLSENAEVKAYYQSSLDSGIGKGVASFKEKTLPKIIEEEIKKASNKNKSPEELRIEELENKLAQIEKDKIRAEMSSKYTKILSEKGLSGDLLDFILGADEETTNKNIDTLTNIINNSVSEKVKTKITENPPIPRANDGGRELDGVERAFYERTGLKID